MQKVLVADDNKDVALLLQAQIQMEGYDVAVVHDGLQALEYIEQNRPDLVFLDLDMPQLSGFDVCERVRSHEWSKNIRIFALTGWTSPEDRKKTGEAGFDGHFGKPIDVEVVKNILAKGTGRTACEACTALLGALSSVVPHSTLQRHAGKSNKLGTVEFYLCSVCKTLWERSNGGNWAGAWTS